MTRSDQVTGTRRTRRTLALERTFNATAEEVWALWTTKDGIESWWGPEGFTVTVLSIDLRPNGRLRYVMTATAPEQVAFMERAGMPLAGEAVVTYTEVVPLQRLRYFILADFVPGVAPYQVETIVTLYPNAGGVRMVLSFGAMHDNVWTQRAVMGHESELRKLEAVIGASQAAL